MAPQRLAVATVFICIGVLLLSACGLPLRPAPRVQPSVLGGNFAIYSADHVLIAEGSLDTTTDPAHLSARITMHSPTCLHQRMFAFVGTLSPTLKLRSDTVGGPQVFLQSNTAPVYTANAVRVLPFQGVLTLADSCENMTMQVEANSLQHSGAAKQ